MEAVQVAAGGFELFDPAMRLSLSVLAPASQEEEEGKGRRPAYLCDHHVAVERPSPVGLTRSWDVGADLSHDRSSEGHVRNKMPVHNVDVQPVAALVHLVGAFLAQL